MRRVAGLFQIVQKLFSSRRQQVQLHHSSDGQIFLVRMGKLSPICGAQIGHSGAVGM
jgi:hypothetical protein